ncbi:MAG: hypothetical protein ACJAWH_002125 [Maribacter sp.]|jgi:hypothetical protein
MNKKKLDELFRDTLSDFKEAPDDRVWASIETSLDKKKKKRVLPLWWSLGGIAAALLVGLLIFNPFDQNTPTEQIITDIKQNNPDPIINLNDAPNILEIDQNKEDAIEVATDNKTETILEETEVPVVTLGGVQNKSSEDSPNGNHQKNKKIESDWSKEREAVVQTQNTKGQNSIRLKNEGYQDINKTKLKTDIAITETQELLKETTKETNTAQNSQVVEKVVRENKETAIADNNTEKAKKTTTTNGLIDSDVVEKTGATSKDSQVTANQVMLQKDSLNSANKKSIFDEIEIKEEEAVAKTSTNKWSAGPSIAPVYFNAIGEGSSVHSIFVPNSKSGNINMSYGLSVGYEISPKLTVRSGIHKVDFGYDTNDIAFSSSPIASTNGQIDNINYRVTSKNLVVSSKPGGSALEQALINSLDVSAQNAEREGVMTQQMGYLEIPLELNYALIDKKFGLNVIGGVSSLFLVDNSVALTSGDLTTEMGDANNLNDLNFSANFGLGVNYKFSRNIQLNIEPVFKYQLNTFSETDGTFNPYALGVYSGLRFKF